MSVKQELFDEMWQAFMRKHFSSLVTVYMHESALV
jgi:hypothetical protein